MAAERYDDTVPPRRGVSLAKGPVALIGVASLALGVLGLILASHDFTMDVPSGTVAGDTFLGIEGNGWTWLLFTVAGLLLLLGSPVHWGAKSMAFVVGVAMLVGALIALSDGDDILGIFATNNWTKLVLGAAGAGLIALSMMPRVGRRRGGAPASVRRKPGIEENRLPGREPAVEDDRLPGREHAVEREPIVSNGNSATRREGTLDDRL